jgi:putative intracellular protease/amidase
LEELAVPYYMFRKKGYQVVVCSIQGGEIPIDNASLQGDFFTPTTKEFMEDEGAMDKIKSSLPIADIDFKTVDVRCRGL